MREVISFHFVLKPVLDLLPAVVLLPGVSVASSARGGVPAPVVVRARLVLLPAVLVVVLGEAPDLLRSTINVESQGCNSIDILNFGPQTGRKTGPSSGPHSVLGHSEFRHVSKLQT